MIKVSKPILKLINLPRAVYEKYRFEVEYDKMSVEENKIKDKSASNSDSKKEVISATSESTDD